MTERTGERVDLLTGPLFHRMLSSAMACLGENVDEINALNVYPVPDGDTGINMLMTMQSAMDHISDPEAPLGTMASEVSMGSLMGARGNSGVILSQLFRGLAAPLGGESEAGPSALAAAMESGVRAAYSAVMRPVEGTILTVARRAAGAAVEAAAEDADLAGVLRASLDQARQTLERTPEMLDVLRDAGVVDAGGRGLVCILQGALQGLTADVAVAEAGEVRAAPLPEAVGLEYPYDVVLLMRRASALDGEALDGLGDSLIVIDEEDMVKVHIHTDDPVAVLSVCMKSGEMLDLHIQNMEFQGATAPPQATNPPTDPDRSFAIIPIAAGEGLRRAFLRLGAARVVSGGPTMNPSTEDIMGAVEECGGAVVLLPNNPNLLLACEQVRDLSEQTVVVVPTENIPQGLAAMLVDPLQARDASTAARRMSSEIGGVTALEVTYAVDDRQFSGMKLAKGDIIGFADGELLSVGPGPAEVLVDLLRQCDGREGERLTVFTGKMIDEEAALDLEDTLKREFSGRVEILYGGQDHYHFIAALG